VLYQMRVSWRLSDVDETAAARLAATARLRPLTARILVARGLVAAEQVTRFLTPRLGDLRPPAGMADLDRALERLARAVRDRETIGVFGDYDVDGVTAAAVLGLGLSGLGATVVPRAASRSAGYGLPPAAVARFADEGCRVLVTADCGTTDFAALALARERGLDVVVIDHHQVPVGESPAFALINPHRPDDRFPFKGLASCGIAFYLVASLRTRMASAAFDPRTLLDLVALGTVADLVPLVEENRILVAAGLRELGARRRPGLRALAALAGLDEPALSTEDVSFRLGPRLNAAGRLGEAQLALDLLLAADEAGGAALAAALDDRNRERREIQERVWSEVVAAAEPWAEAPAIVVGAAGWHPGVVGIVAARLVDRFRRPAVVIGFEGEEGRGSARTCDGVDLYQALAACREHLTRFGGHAAAAGLSLAPERLAGFRAAFAEAVGRHRPAGPASRALVVDGVVDLAEVDVYLAEELSRLAPFGVANGEPVLAVPGVVATATRVVGQGHLQLELGAARGGRARGEAIAFNMADQDPGRGASLDLIGTADLETFRGTRRARLRVKHLVRSQAAETQ
jgi:single-stranded-DNA-specific exonuclease